MEHAARAEFSAQLARGVERDGLRQELGALQHAHRVHGSQRSHTVQVRAHGDDEVAAESPARGVAGTAERHDRDDVGAINDGGGIGARAPPERGGDHDEERRRGDPTPPARAGARCDRLSGRRGGTRSGARRGQRGHRRRHGLEAHGHLVRALRPLGRILRHQSRDQCRDRRRHIGAALFDPRDRRREMRGHHRLRVPAVRGSASEHLVEHCTRRVEVRTMIGRRVGHRLLGGHVGWRAERESNGGEPALGDPRIGERLRHAEVRHHRVPPLEQDVLGLHVAMHDPMVVCERQRVQELARDAQCVGQRERPLPHEARPERLSGNVGHHVPEQRVVAAGGEHRHDVRVLQLRDEFDLAPEALSTRGDGALEVEDLHHHAPIEGTVGREEYAGHPAAAELAIDREGVAERALEARGEVVLHRGEGTACGAARRPLGPRRRHRSRSGTCARRRRSRCRPARPRTVARRRSRR